ncbi:MFS transporter [Microbacterium sp. ANT_H45B]|uniref:MFS transporter n=1 Tax=Microbacterium TaxID=33882 RepID=UPI0011F02B9D|nr:MULTISPECIES: MFS transporter [Microbacterium]KAA0962647.1 MFS transporter [Microbacterium sp. ANT_H45B]MCP1427687.1 DHA3 family multidrug efflux protein-like MFS transporter [Microbacterium foliorum]
MARTAAKTAFANVLVNTLVANVTTSFLWFALTFWVYIETQSVLATGIIGGAYMLFIAFFAMIFGTIVDRHRKHTVMVLSSVVSALAFLVAGALYVWQSEAVLLDLGGPWFWIFSVIILFGGVIEQLRNIALSTTVTLLVPEERRANANGLVGTVQGLAFLVTSVFSGLSIGFLGMGWTLGIAIAAMVLTVVHLLFIRIPEQAPTPDPEAKSALDFRGSVAAIRLAPGLFALIIFSTFNNLIGGVYMALMDPYGLTLFDAQTWGFALAFASTGFIIGGGLVAKFGLGPKPMRTLLFVVIAMGLLGSVFMLREWWPLYVIGMWVYMALVPPVEAAEQTVIQKVVRYDRQGRVFGVAAAMEAAAAPITAFLIAPIAEFLIIPYMKTADGQRRWEWLLGEGDARGIALICLFAGLVMVVVGVLAFFTRSYRTLTELYANAPVQDPGGEDGASDESPPDAPAPVRGSPPEMPEFRR